MDEEKVTVTVTESGRRVTGEYRGGAYIDLTFGRVGHPTEVVNVWDYGAGGPVIPFTVAGVASAVAGWMEDNDVEWPEWYEDYLANARW